MLLLLLFLPIVLSIPLTVRVTDLEDKSIELMERTKMARKLNQELRTEVVTFFLDFVQLHQEVLEGGDPILLYKISRIAARLRSGLRVNLPHVKKRLSKVVTGLLAPLFFPFYLLEEQKNIQPIVTEAPPVLLPQSPIPQWSNNFVNVDYPMG